MKLLSHFPAAAGTALIALVSASTPIMLQLGVHPQIVAAVAASIVPFVAFVGALIHAHVVPLVNVALTKADAAGLTTKPAGTGRAYTVSVAPGGGGGGGNSATDVVGFTPSSGSGAGGATLAQPSPGDTPAPAQPAPPTTGGK